MRLSISKACALLGVFGVMVLLSTGCKWFPPGPTLPPVPPPSTNPPPSSLQLRPGDHVKLDYFSTGVTIPPHEEEVKDDGTINIEQVGAIEVKGMTAREVEKVILAKLVPAYYRSLTVTVTALDRYYTVGGQVTHPGPLRYNGPTTVTKAIQAAGDFTDFADRHRLLITRADGKQEVVDFDEATRNPTKDLEIYPHDQITVDHRF